MKPKLHQLPCGDWVPVEFVTAITVNDEIKTPTQTRHPHVIVSFDGGMELICSAGSDVEAKAIAAKLGEAVNDYRVSVFTTVTEHYPI